MFDFASAPAGYRPFPQTAAYATAARACGAGVVDLDLGVGRALVLRRAGRQLVSRGPVWQPDATWADQRNALRHLARFAGVTLVTPEQDLRGAGLIPIVTPMHHVVWDLAGNLRAGMVGKWRNRLRAAELAELQITPAPNLLQQLVLAEAELRALRRYRAHSAQFTLALPPDALRLFQWRHDDEMAAGMAFVVEGATATYHLGWANAAARGRGAHGLMLYRAAHALRGEGVRWLDLGSVDTESAPGLARFKLGTGAALRCLGHTLLVLPG